MITRSASSGQPLNLALIGLGYWGPNLLRVLVDTPGVHVRWICDRDAVRLSDFARRYPACFATTDVDEILSDDTVDAVLIATPVWTHFDLASRSLAAGKHTFVEKPLAPSAEEAETLVSMAAEEDVVLMCGHTFLYSPPVRAVKKLIRDGELGDLFFVSSSRVNLGLHQRDVSVIWDLGPHDFSILLHWLDEMPRSVRAIGRDSIVAGIHDVAFVSLTYDSGIVANVELSWLAPSKLRRTVIVGNKKMVVYDDGSNEPIRVFDHGVEYEDPQTFGEYRLSYRTGNIVSPKLESHEPLAAEMADFADAIRRGDPSRIDTGLALDVVRLTEAADASLHAGGSEVELSERSRFARSRALVNGGRHL